MAFWWTTGSSQKPTSCRAAFVKKGDLNIQNPKLRIPLYRPTTPIRKNPGRHFTDTSGFEEAGCVSCFAGFTGTKGPLAQSYQPADTQR